MRRAVQCEYRTVPYGGGVSLLSYLLLVLLCRIHSVIRISYITGTTPDKYNMLYEMSRIPDETVISVRAR